MPLILNLVILLFPFYQLSELPLNLPFRIYGLDLLIVFAVFLNQKQIYKHPLKSPFLVFTSFCLLSLLIAFLNNPKITPIAILASSFYIVRLILYALLASIKVKNHKIFSLSLWLVIVGGIIQYLMLPDTRFLKAIGYDDHYHRLIFPFLDPNFTGILLVFCFFYFFTKNKTAAILSVIALALTFSRASYLSFIFGLLTLCITRWKIKPLVLFAPILLIAVLLAPKPFGEGVNLFRTFSVTARLDDYQTAIKLFQKNPLLGVGFNTLKYQQESILGSRSQPGASNSYLFLLATTGILGFGTFIFLIFRYLQLISPDQYLFSATSALAFHALFNNTLFFAPLTILLVISLKHIKEKTSP